MSERQQGTSTYLECNTIQYQRERIVQYRQYLYKLHTTGIIFIDIKTF